MIRHRPANFVALTGAASVPILQGSNFRFSFIFKGLAAIDLPGGGSFEDHARGGASVAKKKATTRKKTTKKTRTGASKSSSAKKATATKKKAAKKKTPARKKATKRTSAGGSKRRTAAAKSGSNHRAPAGSRSTNHKPAASDYDPIQFPEEQPKLPKSPLKAKELREFKALLIEKLGELTGDVQQLTNEALHRGEEGGSDSSYMPIHMADIGSDNWEQDFALGLIDTERTVIQEILRALERIENKTYGVCLATHAPISLARLRAKPWAKYCIEYARALEDGRAG